MADVQELSLLQTLSGRLRNFPLSPSPDNALWGVYEAISNSLHAIADAGIASDGGRVDVSVNRNSDGEVAGFEIRDNGVGLNHSNFESFRKIDSTHKLVRGGKGVGRLTWLKTFDSINVTSVFNDADDVKERSFVFYADDTTPIKKHLVVPAEKEIGTKIEMTGYKVSYQKECPKRSDTISRSIIRHFLKDLVSPSGVGIYLHDDRVYDLRQEFNKSIIRRSEANFESSLNGESHKFKLTNLVTSKAFTDHDTKENAVYLLAHGRVVGRRPIGNMLGLKKLQGGKTYVGLVESEYLDAAVNQERTMLSADSAVVDAIVRAAVTEVEDFLSTDTKQVRDRQLLMVRQIKKEYPRFMSTLADEENYVNSRLQLSVRDQESIFRTVSLDWYRNKRRVDRAVRSGLSNPKNSEEFKLALEQAKKSIADESKAIIADYIAERKVVIDFFDRLVGKVRGASPDSYELEATIHDLVVPRKSNTSNIKFDTHNLWLIDERLPYYKYFNSDMPISQQVEGSNDKRRPDIMMTDVVSAFNTNSNGDPFILVEFKRPGRDDYNSKDDPIKQCLDYVAEIKSGKSLVDSDGKWISGVDENSVFYCYVVADITPSLMGLINLHDLDKMPDGKGYFKYHSKLKAWVEVVPFDKLIENNRVRHNTFFEKVGIT